MDREFIIEKVKGCMYELLCVPKEDMGKANLSEPLTGGHFQLKARDLVYLYFALEELFGVKFTQDNIISGNFISIQNIAANVEAMILSASTAPSRCARKEVKR